MLWDKYGNGNVTPGLGKFKTAFVLCNFPQKKKKHFVCKITNPFRQGEYGLIKRSI